MPEGVLLGNHFLLVRVGLQPVPGTMGVNLEYTFEFQVNSWGSLQVKSSRVYAMCDSDPLPGLGIG